MEKLFEWVSRPRAGDAGSKSTVISAKTTSGQSCLLCNLPVFVLEIICLFLVDNSEPESTYVATKRDFRKSIYDLMRLRASCYYLYNFINNLTLKLDCEIDWTWYNCQVIKKLRKFLNFMVKKTNWQFKSVRIDLNFGFVEAHEMRIFRQIENLSKQC